MKFQGTAGQVTFLLASQEFGYSVLTSQERGLLNSSKKEVIEGQVDWNDVLTLTISSFTKNKFGGIVLFKII